MKTVRWESNAYETGRKDAEMHDLLCSLMTPKELQESFDRQVLNDRLKLHQKEQYLKGYRQRANELQNL